MAYVDIPDADVDLDSFGKETDVFQRLRDNIRAGRETVFAWPYAEQSTNSATFVTLDSVRLFVPNVPAFTGIARQIIHDFEAKIAPAGTGTYRLRDNVSGNTGTEVTTTNTSYEAKSATLNIDAG